MSEKLSTTSETTDVFIDQEWHDDLTDILASYEATYDLIKLDKNVRDQKRIEFEESGRTTNPDLTPDIDPDLLADKDDRLVELKQKILDQEENEDLRNAYVWKINELLADTRMASEAHNGESRHFHWYNYFAYGKPDQLVYESTNNYFRQFAERLVNSDDPTMSELAQNVLDTLPEFDDKNLPDIKPEEELFDELKESHKEFFAKLLDGVEIEDSFIGWQTQDEQTKKVMKNAGIGDFDLVEPAKGGSGWSVKVAKKQVARPNTKINHSKERFIGLPVGHEIGTHAAEYINGMASNIGIVALGLDRYGGASEAKGVLREQIAFESFEDFEQMVRFQDILRRHYAISTAYFSETVESDEVKGDFKDVFNTLNTIDRLWSYYKKPDDYDAAMEKADKRTWSLMSERTQKGTDGSGGAYFKDKIYLEANIAYWELANEHPELTEYWDLGKIDLTNPRHISFLQKLGVLPVQEQ